MEATEQITVISTDPKRRRGTFAEGKTQIRFLLAYVPPDIAGNTGSEQRWEIMVAKETAHTLFRVWCRNSHASCFLVFSSLIMYTRTVLKGAILF